MKKEELKNRHQIQCCYGPGGLRNIVLADIIAVLYERGHAELAQELTTRANKVFESLDKDDEERKKKVEEGYSIWTVGTMKTQQEIDELIEKTRPWWRFW